MLKKVQKIVFYSLLVYATIGFVVLPYILKSQLLKIVQQETNTKLSVVNISFNPFIFKLKLDGIELTDMNNTHLVSLKSLTLNLELYSLFNSSVHIKSFILEKPDISLVYKKDKTINFASIVKKNTQKEDIKDEDTLELPRIIIDNISIIDGSLDYEDYTHETKFNFSFHRIGFELKDIDTADFSTSDATIRFFTVLGDGGFVDLNTQILSYSPLVLKGDLNFEASKLYTEWKYMQDILNLEVADGKVDFSAEYFVNFNDLNATTVDNINGSISKLRIKPKDRYKDVLNLDSLVVSDVSVKPMQQKVHISSVNLNTLYLKLKRDKEKKIDWLEYIKTNKERDNSIDDSSSKEIWNLDIDDISLKNIKIDFDDEGVSPHVLTRLNELNIYLQDVTLAGDNHFSYQIDFRLNEVLSCRSKGTIKHNNLDIKSYSRCSNLDITKFNPYIDEMARNSLDIYDLDLKSARLNFDANISVIDKDNQIYTGINYANISLNDFKLNKRSTKESLVDFSSFSIDKLVLDTDKKKIDIDSVVVDALDIKTKLYKNYHLNLEDLVVLKEFKDDKNTKLKEKQTFLVNLKSFAFKNAKLSFNDETLNPSLKTSLDKINIDINNISSKTNSWLSYKVKARLNRKGYIKTNGKLQHTPLKQKGTFNLEEISLKEFSPYVQKSTYLKLKDGYIDLKTRLSYEKNKKTADLKVDGNLNVNEFFLYDTRDDSTLLSFNKMKLDSFNYELSPDRAFVNELDIVGFYVNALVDKNKKLNFATLSKIAISDNNTTKKEDMNSTKFPFKIMKLNVSSGSAKFADLSLPLKFKTDIHDLNGVIYSISSQDGEVSYIDISGEVDKYGSTKLIGSIESSNPKLYTDLDFNFRNLDLHSLSGYSADFTGYKIDNGKLFLDLGYDILNSELLGKNSIIIKNIKLGDEIEDENLSSLPLGFAIALLEDSNGIIDIDMPVEGNVDEPDFKYGALLWKTFGNLILKAVASPFKFLGSAMGIDGEELAYIEFEAGVANILPPEREKLDNIAKLMLKRPKISLKIIPKYDEEQDGWVIKQKKLSALVMKKSGIKNKQEKQNAMNIDILEDIYEELAADKKVNYIKKTLKKQYKDEVFNRMYLNALLKQTTQMQTLSIEELKNLARNRAKVLKDYLVNIKGMQEQRIIVQDVENVDKVEVKWVKTQLEIDVE